MNGLFRIRRAFAEARRNGRAACMPYFTLGYPTGELCQEILLAVARSGADLIELGIPFSDPLADGPTIQRSTQVALENGMSVSGSLEMVAALRQAGVTQPFLMMSYINPLMSFGLEEFCSQAAIAGADGLIVPDLPPEEGGELEELCRREGLALVYLLAPTSTEDRISLAANHASGFLYLVSVTGVTGARQALPADLPDFIHRVRRVANLPLAVGFGIGSREQAAEVGQVADGVIVGSALINAVSKAEDPCVAATEYIGSLADALQAAKLPG